MKKINLLLLSLTLLCASVQAQPRSLAVRAEFQRLHPCPANGQRRGPCPGWQIDHRIALMCGGPDRVDNLQWITIAAHRIKTRSERRQCRALK